MIEIRSQSFYHFDYKFFEDHFINFYCKCKLIVIKNEFREIVSGALFLCDYPKKIVHYHLSGSSREALKNQCNELMISYVNFHFGKLGYELIKLLNFSKLLISIVNPPAILCPPPFIKIFS